mgnify:FL=1
MATAVAWPRHPPPCPWDESLVVGRKSKLYGERAGLLMTVQKFLPLFAVLSFPACFSPAAGTDADLGSTGSTGEVGEGDTASPTGPSDPGSTGDVPTTGGSTTADPTSGTGTTSPETGETESSTTDETSGGESTGEGGETGEDSTTGGEDPYCGDGNLDPGEECDDGLDNNGLDQSCLPDCNLNVCGDGNLGPGEFCDDGAGDNILQVGACAPDCSTVIEERVITGSSTVSGGNYQPNPVGLADAQCDAGYRALFSVPGVRQATVATPYAADNQIDWPLAPYTAYTRADGTLIWITDSTPLLGVRDGAPVPLDNPVVQPCVPDVPNGVVCFSAVRPTGLNADWTPAASDTCNGWSSNSENLTLGYGDLTSATGFLEGESTVCSTGTGDFGLPGSWPSFYCVEQ